MKNNFKIFIILVLCILTLTGCSFGDDSSKYNINISSPKKVNVNAYLSYNKTDIIVYLKNNTNSDINHFKLNAIFYDKDGNKIDESTSYGWDFQKKSEYALEVYLPYDSKTDSYIPYKTDLSFEIDDEFQQKSIKSYADKVETNYTVKDNLLSLNIKNNSDVNLDFLTIAVLLMKKNKPIYLEEIYKPIEAGKTVSEDIELPTEWDENDEEKTIKYDKVKILILEANGYN